MTKLVLLRLCLLLALLGLPASAIVATVEARAATTDPALAVTLRSRAADQPVSVLVILRDQVNLRSIGGSSRRDCNRRVVRALRKKADDTQGSLRALLQQRRHERQVQAVTPL